jgi:hypothetical protein
METPVLESGFALGDGPMICYGNESLETESSKRFENDWIGARRIGLANEEFREGGKNGKGGGADRVNFICERQCE